MPWRKLSSRSPGVSRTVEPGTAPGTPLAPLGGEVVSNGGPPGVRVHQNRYSALTWTRGARPVTAPPAHGSSPGSQPGCELTGPDVGAANRSASCVGEPVTGGSVTGGTGDGSS